MNNTSGVDGGADLLPRSWIPHSDRSVGICGGQDGASRIKRDTIDTICAGVKAAVVGDCGRGGAELMPGGQTPQMHRAAQICGGEQGSGGIEGHGLHRLDLTFRGVDDARLGAEQCGCRLSGLVRRRGHPSSGRELAGGVRGGGVQIQRLGGQLPGEGDRGLSANRCLVVTCPVG